MKVSEINNNPIAEAWKKRFSQLSEDKKLKIEELKNKKISEYQLKIIKKSKSYPKIGDIFKMKIGLAGLPMSGKTSIFNMFIFSCIKIALIYKK